MSDYKVTDTELTSIANAIRTKGGTSALLEFPSGFVSAIGNISGGGGGGGGEGIPVFTKAAWKALSVEQKQAYGLVGIQYNDEGYNRGFLVNGTDYFPTYLPYSDYANVICEAHALNFDSNESTWGTGTSPITFVSGVGTKQSDDSILLPGYTSGIYGYVDLGQNSTPFTAYIVAKTVGGSTYRRILSAFSNRSTSQGIMLYGQTISVSSWANDTDIGIPSTDYFVGVLRYGENTIGTAINENNQAPNYVKKTPNIVGRYLTIGRTDKETSTTNAEPSDIQVKYVGVVLEEEPNKIISENLAYLLDEFIINS